MTLTLARVESFLSDTIVGGVESGGVSSILLANQAGREMMSMHPWLWAVGGQRYLEFRNSIPALASNGVTITGASWTASTKTLTSSLSFSSYTWRDGDEVEIVSGTNVVPGFYRVVSRPNNNDIVLGRDLQASTGAASAIEFRISLSHVMLPSDFGEIVHMQLSDSLTRFLHPASLADILERRANSVNIDDFNYWYAVNYTQPGTIGQPIPRLEIYPEPRTLDSKAIRMIYRRAWRELSSDNDEVPIPNWMEPLYLAVLTAFALGYDEHDIASVSRRLAEVKAGPVFMDAKRMDGRQQPLIGSSRGGHTRQPWYGTAYQTRQTITSPS